MVDPSPDPRPRRLASAILLFERGADGRLRVFLGERAPQLRFFGGYHALPGGVRAPEDGADDGSDELPLLRCAARELLEELGVVVASGLAAHLDVPARRALREALLAHETTDAGDESPWRRAVGDVDVTDGLRPVCRICTPRFAPIAYDTLFALAERPADQAPEIVTGELVGGRFWDPGEALAAWRQGAIRIVPPVLLLLELMERAGADLEAFVAAARALADRYHAGDLHRVQFSPGIVLAALATPTLPPATTTNTLIVGERELWVVDPATYDHDEQQRLFALLDRMCAEGRTVKGVLVTHHHPDHVGGLAATSERYGVPIRGHARTMERLPPGGIRGEPLADGDRIPLGTAPDGSPDWELVSVFTPGHDQGHLAFRETRYDAVIVGDMLSTVSTIVIDPPEGHLATYLASLEKLLAQPMDTLYPAHGPAAPDGHRLVKQYLRHRQQREAALLKALGEGPATPEELVPKVYFQADPKTFALAARSLLAGLEKLEEEGRARHDGRVWHALDDGDATGSDAD